MKNLPWWILLCGVALTGCNCGPAGVETMRFACTFQDDCIEGFQCVAGECVPPAQPWPEDGGQDRDAGEVEDGGKPCLPSAEHCSNGQDEDCDGFVDCADADCSGKSCGPDGAVCGGNACVCGGNGGPPQQAEQSCADGADNDCDGLVDCMDPDCVGAVCGAFGRVCTGGGCTCSGNGGSPEADESFCSDGVDNDCDGDADCADDSCGGALCDPAGLTCVDRSCLCPPDAGVLFSDEVSCGDNKDNDCDGLLDCADPTCAQLSCGPGGSTCQAGLCTCYADGGVPEAEESSCNDGVDSDCDGLVDCQDPGCDGQTCSEFGAACSNWNCTCTGNGGPIELNESSCGDQADNDCDGLVDCADSDCAAQSCGTNKTCVAEQCVCTINGLPGETNEQSCSDGLDNDCDGDTDCEDNDCARQACQAGSTVHFCCNDSCVDISQNNSHCGGCGLSCKQGCSPYSAGGVTTGRCDCAHNVHCPSSQTCSTGKCVCDASSDCSGGTCTANEGISGPGVCHF